jgi:hypothetical protein
MRSPEFDALFPRRCAAPRLAPLALAAAAALALTSCAGSRCCGEDTAPGHTPHDPPGQPNDPVATGEVAMEVLARGARSGIREFGLHVAWDSATFADLWARHTAGELPPPPLPDIDLGTHTALFVTLGERPTAGYGLEVVRARRHGEQLVLSVRELRPPRDSMQAQVLTQPHALVLVPRTDDPVALLVLPGS